MAVEINTYRLQPNIILLKYYLYILKGKTLENNNELR